MAAVTSGDARKRSGRAAVGRVAAVSPTKPTLTFEEIKALKRPMRQSILVPLDGGLVARLADLERAVAQAAVDDQHRGRLESDAKAPALQAELDELRRELEGDAVVFTFEALGRQRYRDLIAEHPDPGGRLRWDIETFAPALLAACCVEPALAEADAREMWTKWGPEIGEVLVAVAIRVNEGTTVDMTRLAEIIRVRDLGAERAAREDLS